MKRLSSGEIMFEDYPDFRPNLTPHEIFKLGSFGGTYWRPIYSQITKKHYKNKHKKYPPEWWEGISNDKMTQSTYDHKINLYKVTVGTSLEYWEEKDWIHKKDPYGWVQWYCEFYNGRRHADDERQISRWNKIAGKNGRFRRRLINIIISKKTSYNDLQISPKIRQTLQHWGYRLNELDLYK
jgi:hypothetical protein